MTALRRFDACQRCQWKMRESSESARRRSALEEADCERCKEHAVRVVLRMWVDRLEPQRVETIL